MYCGWGGVKSIQFSCRIYTSGNKDIPQFHINETSRGVDLTLKDDYGFEKNIAVTFEQTSEWEGFHISSIKVIDNKVKIFFDKTSVGHHGSVTVSFTIYGE